MFDKVLDEFAGLTNALAYVKIFSRRMMKPVPFKTGEFFGTDQRKDILPFLLSWVFDLPENSQVFDVGAGAGDVVDYALKNAPKNTVINIEEPNSTMVHAYLNRLKKYPYLKQGVVYQGPIQDYYQTKKITILPQKPQNLILAIHMIYHLTDFDQPSIDPKTDLIHAISFLYELLAPQGTLFIVYADLLDHDQKEATCGMGEKFFRKFYPHDCFADNLLAIYQARNQLLGPNGIIGDLLSVRYPQTKPILKSEWRECHFFGETVEDIAVLGLAAELCPSNEEPFDLTKLEFCLDYVSKYPEKIGLQREERDVPQKGLWRSNEPQVIVSITKSIFK